MSTPLSEDVNPPSANSTLAAQIVAAMQAEGLIGNTECAETMALLTTKSAKSGEWRALLEKQLNVSPITSDRYASPD
jgi:uncharacterized membrane protein YebE (DUF533 family)